MRSTTPQSTLEDATRTARRERRQLADEKRAFERFAARVDRIEPVQSHTGEAGTVIGVRPSGGVDAVRTAYAETVMDTPHYSEMYDETVLESIAEELGAELAAAVEHRSRFTLQVKGALDVMTTEAVVSRERLLSGLDDEIESLERAERRLSEVHSELESLRTQPIEQLEFNALRLTRERLCGLRETCDDVAEKRQARIHRRRSLSLADVGSFERYLYADREYSYPVLSVVADLGGTIERTLERTDRRLVATER